jgi:hypothetical protein
MTALKVVTSDFTSTTQSLVTITGLSFTAVASTNYWIDAWLDVTTSAVVTGVEFGVTSSGTSPAVFCTAQGGTGATGATSLTEIIIASATATPAFLTVSASEGFVHIFGVVKSGIGSPTISLSALKVTSGTVTVKVGSVLYYRAQ